MATDETFWYETLIKGRAIRTQGSSEYQTETDIPAKYNIEQVKVCNKYLKLKSIELKTSCKTLLWNRNIGLTLFLDTDYNHLNPYKPIYLYESFVASVSV